MPAVPDQLDTDLLDRIPLAAKVVLDVACGTGALGAAYRRLNPRARLLGIEGNADAAAIAAQRLDEVAVVDVASDPLPFAAGPIDCIIYNGVLERLSDPWAVMRRHVEVLSDDGVMLICVPNVEHWRVTERLLRGNQDGQAAGLSDMAQLSRFSLESTRQGLEALGVVLCDVHPRIVDGEAAKAFTTSIAPVLTALGVDPQTYLNRSAPVQYVWRVRKRPRERMVIAATMLRPVGGVSHVRVVYPLQALRTDPSVATQIVATRDFASPPKETPHIFVLHRIGLAGDEGISVIRQFLKDDWILVSEFDDHPDHFGMLHAPDQYAFRGVHAVQTSTPALADVLRTLNPEVAIFPNMVRSLPDVRNFPDPERFTVFFGALNRERDWEPLMPALNAVAETMGDRLRFCVVHDKAFFDALRSPHKQFTPTCDHDTYMALLGQCEISLMPLSDTPFNRAKSDLKFIESGACRVASLASHIVYSDSVIDGRTGLLFHNPDEFRDRLLRVTTTPDLARTLGDAARSYVMNERMLAYQVAQRTAWYRSLWARRVELTNALHRRMLQASPQQPQVPQAAGAESTWAALRTGGAS